LVGLGIRRVDFGKALLFLARQTNAQSLGNLFGDLLLEREDVGWLPAVLLAPDVAVVGGIYEFGTNRQVVASLCDPAYPDGVTEI
jgi:hypothetical protein